MIKTRGSRGCGNYFFKKFGDLRERGDSLCRKFCFFREGGTFGGWGMAVVRKQKRVRLEFKLDCGDLLKSDF